VNKEPLQLHDYKEVSVQKGASVGPTSAILEQAAQWPVDDDPMTDLQHAADAARENTAKAYPHIAMTSAQLVTLLAMKTVFSRKEIATAWQVGRARGLHPQTIADLVERASGDGWGIELVMAAFDMLPPAEGPIEPARLDISFDQFKRLRELAHFDVVHRRQRREQKEAQERRQIRKRQKKARKAQR
jgi:hypothetical protein